MNARSLLYVLTIGALCLASTLIAAEPASPTVQIPPGPEILKLLKPEHPRLLATRAELTRALAQEKTNAQLQAWHRDLRGQAERILTAAPSRYEIPDGLRLLSVSRRVLNRIYTLALLARLDQDKRFVERAWLELDAAARFPDWNPRHFLDTAEMTHAFAIGYDWLYDSWTVAQRSALRKAIVEKGLNPGLTVYNARSGWHRARHNWNQVCNGGMVMGALALGELEPELSGRILEAALRSVQLPMTEYGPDGAWAEGPGYWNYATTYNVALLAAVESALGTDFKLSQIPGFSHAGNFPIYATGPFRRTFNYADAGEGAIRAPLMYWLARKFSRPAYAAYENAFAAPQALDWLWYVDTAPASGLSKLPLDMHFRGADVVALRSAWDNPQALFCGFKAGDNKANHSHLDLGTFVFDALGTRWAVDPGADDYNMPGYFGRQRWTYYRLRAEGHNTLVINPGTGPDQDPRAAASILKFNSKPELAFTVADLTPAYAGHAQKVWRGIALLNRKALLVQDEIQTRQPAEVWWFMHTGATAEANGRTANLVNGSSRLTAQILSPANATFTVLPAVPLPGSPKPERQNPNRNIRKLAIHLQATDTTRLAVLLVPSAEGQDAKPDLPVIQPLSDW